MADLPDYYTQAQISEAEAASFDGGLDANKSATPVSRDIYLATDTHILYACFTDGTWTGFDAAILTQGILTLYANMVAGGYKVTGLGAPTAQNDALRYGQAEIRNTEIKADAAITYAKLALTGALLMADFAAAIKNAANGIVVLDASADVPLAQIPDTLTGKDADTLDGYEISDIFPHLTVADFQARAATGTASDPAYANDNNITLAGLIDNIVEYIEIDFSIKCMITQYRYYGNNMNNDDGKWSIKRYDDESDSWIDWITDIPTRGASWTEWTAGTTVVTSKIRIMSPTLDSQGSSWFNEWEIKY